MPIANAPVLFIAFMGGFIPALLWLVFWQLEDRCDPEPKRYILLAFVVGMLIVPLVLPFQFWAKAHTHGGTMLFLWAVTEELIKFLAAWFLVLRSRAVDEPIDAIIYMLTVALGFSALENTLFLIGPIAHGDTVGTLLAGNLRFIGATLLHTLASATVGISLALSFYRNKHIQRMYVLCGLVVAIALHTLFNFFILEEGGNSALGVFLCVWIGVVVVLLFFERLKRPSRDYC